MGYYVPPVSAAQPASLLMTILIERMGVVRPLASSLFLFLPYMDSMRKMKPVWLRRLLASAVSYLPWTAAREVIFSIPSLPHVMLITLEYSSRERLTFTIIFIPAFSGKRSYSSNKEGLQRSNKQPRAAKIS
jgi:hypothetical protein